MFDLDEYIIRYDSGRIEIVRRFFGEPDYIHDLIDNPLGMHIENTFLFLGEPVKHLPVTKCKFQATTVSLQFRFQKRRYICRCIDANSQQIFTLSRRTTVFVCHGETVTIYQITTL